MKLLLDEMYSATVAVELRRRGFDVVSVHDPDYRHLEGASDQHVFGAAVALERAIVTENVSDFRRLETGALARGEPHPGLVYATNRQFPRRGSVSRNFSIYRSRTTFWDCCFKSIPIIFGLGIYYNYCLRVLSNYSSRFNSKPKLSQLFLFRIVGYYWLHYW